MNETSHEHHAMEHVQTYPSGVEEWYCPTCGRRMLLNWPPEYKRIILSPGDEYAVHTSSKGGLQITALDVPEEQVVEQQDVRQEEQQHLEPWLDWMDAVDFEDLWRREL